MSNRTAKPSGLTSALLETAADMRKGGLIDDATHEKITLRHLDEIETPEIGPVSPAEIRALREKAHMSQAVFAKRLNLTTGYVSQLERGAKRPTGAALLLFNIIRRKGIEAIL
jgi:putative transcriptional regulator